LATVEGDGTKKKEEEMSVYLQLLAAAYTPPIFFCRGSA
jgi:hypothetical protein